MKGLSRMRGNSHVRFLGGPGLATARAYPVAAQRYTLLRWPTMKMSTTCSASSTL
ncbi:MAG: hypothetical protein JRI73_12580 [Deltaproteobacteria bacterium]|nr:hypothetical protein [Deltaproteobacteria bacterium]